VDNVTLWLPNYDRQHFQDLYFSHDPAVDSVKNYYEKQSSGRYSVEGTVTDWVRVRFNQARYGRKGAVRHRGGLRLPVRAGVLGRRRELDRAGRHGRRGTVRPGLLEHPPRCPAAPAATGST
jgi:hypothetical protein